MYSVILMAALTANTAEAPAFHWQKAHGCYGGLYLHSGEYGSCMGCWGAGYGCCGGGWGGCYGCSGGCWGGCYGGGCYGCMGCYGVYNGGSCCGCSGGGYTYGCYGGWYGYGAATDYGYRPATYPAGNPMSTVTAPGAAPAPATGTAPTPPATGTPAPPAGGTPAPPATGAKPAGTSAKLIIEKPADAKIYVDGQMVTSDGTRQAFATPALMPAQAYYYTVRVEAVRDGKPTGETRRVIVRAGETVQETFREPAVVTAAAGN